MLVVTVNRTIALIKCKHPEYNTEIKVQYVCDSQTSQWELTYQNDNFTCRKLGNFYKKILVGFYLADYNIPPMAVSINVSQPPPNSSITSKRFLFHNLVNTVNSNTIVSRRFSARKSYSNVCSNLLDNPWQTPYSYCLLSPLPVMTCIIINWNSFICDISSLSVIVHFALRSVLTGNIFTFLLRGLLGFKIADCF
jgi:hypothetical protein